MEQPTTTDSEASRVLRVARKAFSKTLPSCGKPLPLEIEGTTPARRATRATRTDPTAEACRRLFELMDRQPPNQRQTTQDPHARMMAAYAAMFGQPHEELDA